MTLKTKMSLLVFLTTVSIVSVGFSSWSITAESQAEIAGKIEVDNVINSDKYIKLDTTKGENNSGIDCFKYQDYGYLNESGTNVSSDAYIKAYFILDLEMCDDLFVGDYKSIEIKAKLKYTDETNTTLNLFKQTVASNGSSNITASIISYTNGINPTISNIAGTNELVEYTSNITFNNLLDFYENNKSITKINFAIQYKLFATTGDFFYQNIFQYLYKDMISTGENGEQIDFKLEMQVSAK